MRRWFVALSLAIAVPLPLAAEAVHVLEVVQKGRSFSVPELDIVAGDTVRFTNEDSFLHQIFVHSPAFNIDSDEQRPGENVDVRFLVAGEFQVLCAIHPKMVLSVRVR